MDVTIKSGKVLIDRGEVDDAVIVEAKIAELKERWDGLCALSVERYVFNNCANELSRYPHKQEVIEQFKRYRYISLQMWLKIDKTKFSCI